MYLRRASSVERDLLDTRRPSREFPLMIDVTSLAPLNALT